MESEQGMGLHRNANGQNFGGNQIGGQEDAEMHKTQALRDSRIK